MKSDRRVSYVYIIELVYYSVSLLIRLAFLCSRCIYSSLQTSRHRDRGFSMINRSLNYITKYDWRFSLFLFLLRYRNFLSNCRDSLSADGEISQLGARKFSARVLYLWALEQTNSAQNDKRFALLGRYRKAFAWRFSRDKKSTRKRKRKRASEWIVD